MRMLTMRMPVAHARAVAALVGVPEEFAEPFQVSHAPLGHRVPRTVPSELLRSMAFVEGRGEGARRQQ